MLFPMRGALGYLQPFHFTGPRAGERQGLEKEVGELLKSSMAPATAGHGLGFRPPTFSWSLAKAVSRPARHIVNDLSSVVAR
jgi:hypothetical protein